MKNTGKKLITMNRYLILILVFFAGLRTVYSQIGNNMCEGALPFCTGTSYSFPGGTGTPSAQTGPYYNCLNTTPNPAWYYMKIALPGMIQITMHSEPSLDIDFCCWGPFDSQNACGQLTSSKVVDCSYSMAATEVVDIANAVQGKYYILIITNFSNQPCNIIFSQTGGQGKTDCTILPPAASNDGPLCVGETLHLHAANMNNAVYHWTGPDGWSSFTQNPTRPNVTLAMAGSYSLFVTVNGVPSADTNQTNVGIYNKPTATLTGGESICQGDSSLLTIACQNHPPWSVTLTANGLNPTNIPVSITPHSFYVHPLANTTYALSSVSNEICNGITSGTAVVNVNPVPQVDFSFDNNCSGYATTFSDASSIPGGNAAAWHWDFGVFGDTSNIQNPVFTYASGGTYSVLLKVTSNNGCKGQVIKPVLIHPTPLVNAGIDKSIPYGTNTTLAGVASGGSGSYSYHWEPANLLVNANVANPVTVNLSATTDFTLTVVDQGNACQQSDIITVTITGGPMGVQLTAEPAAICHGGTTVINSQTGGGSGTYSYEWHSDPSGFSSTLEDITVQPQITTTYILNANDGFTFLTKSITITVYPDPVVNPGISQTIPNGTSTMLSGSATSGIGPYAYSWTPANLVTTPHSNSTSTLILSTTTSFTLTVTDNHGCVSSNTVLITITGGPLMVNPQASSSPICKGESTTLHPMTEGGSGSYTYAWSLNGNTFSTATDPVVSPEATTTYHLVISDGYTQNTGNVTVLVNPLPFMNLIPAGAHTLHGDTILACVFDTVTLSATGANLSYLWSNGANTPEIISATTGMAFDMLSYSVDVTNTLTGCSNSDAVTVMFTFGECSYGIPENDKFAIVTVYPNPTPGVFYCRIDEDFNQLKLEVWNLEGSRILQTEQRINSGTAIPVNLKDQPAGVYLLKLYNNDFMKIVRIVKL
jgi:hypothetical protein